MLQATAETAANGRLQGDESPLGLIHRCLQFLAGLQVGSPRHQPVKEKLTEAREFQRRSYRLFRQLLPVNTLNDNPSSARTTLPRSQFFSQSDRALIADTRLYFLRRACYEMSPQHDRRKARIFCETAGRRA